MALLARNPYRTGDLVGISLIILVITSIVIVLTQTNWKTKVDTPFISQTSVVTSEEQSIPSTKLTPSLIADSFERMFADNPAVGEVSTEWHQKGRSGETHRGTSTLSALINEDSENREVLRSFESDLE